MTLCWNGAEEFSDDFFSLRFFGVCPWAGQPGRALGPHSALRTLTAPARDPIGHLHGPWGWGGRSPRRTRLLTRHLEEVWFPSHACHALLSSLFTSLFAGKREAPRPGGVGGPGEAPAGATFKFGARGAQAAQKCKLRRHDFRARAGLKFFLARICWAGGAKRPRL